jgi:magnesium chelatase accessory protein
MMAQWDLDGLARDLGRMPVPVATMVGESDRTVAPRDAWRVQQRLPPVARRPVLQWPRLGHLAHEEAPDLVAGSVADAWQALSAPGRP